MMAVQNKRTYFIVGAVVILFLIATVVIWTLVKKPSVSPVEDFPSEESEKESTYSTLPETKSLTNPLENSPELNPAERTNPFKDAYENPFE